MPGPSFFKKNIVSFFISKETGGVYSSNLTLKSYMPESQRVALSQFMDFEKNKKFAGF